MAVPPPPLPVYPESKPRPPEAASARQCPDSLNERDLRVALIPVFKELPPGQVSGLLCGVECENPCNCPLEVVMVGVGALQSLGRGGGQSHCEPPGTPLPLVLSQPPFLFRSADSELGEVPAGAYGKSTVRVG